MSGCATRAFSVPPSTLWRRSFRIQEGEPKWACLHRGFIESLIDDLEPVCYEGEPEWASLHRGFTVASAYGLFVLLVSLARVSAP
ncbi:unnamed protein product [Trifolium pratense]|uniref:Uncharacterized protein n=1 Tax=Trifolium pratense TaxID=57577 RepID=A0ACB0IRF7_TRIPR|nr:unnamed protein product [Trifolium pratense]